MTPRRGDQKDCVRILKLLLAAELPSTEIMDQNKILNRLESYEAQISSSMDTKSDVSYHMMKQSLHNIWSAIYASESSDSRTANIKKCQECLMHLERKVKENEHRKYQMYYGKHIGGGRSEKCC